LLLFKNKKKTIESALKGRGARWEQGVRKPLAAISAAMANGDGLYSYDETLGRPAAVDWTGKATTSVNNQGQCGYVCMCVCVFDGVER
jgi:hypothetical protein